jgi:hypothetical protein
MQTFNHLHLFLPGKYSSNLDLERSNLASIRMRAAVAASAFSENLRNSVSAGDISFKNPKFVFIGKIGADCENGRSSIWIEQLRRYKGLGVKIILDYTDHHLGFTSPMTSFYKEAITLADAITLPSQKLKDLIGKTSITNYCIPDPIEVNTEPVNNSTRDPSNILWFGHSTNAPYFIDFILSHRQALKNKTIYALSNEFGIQEAKKNLSNTNIKIKYGIWSLESMRQISRISGACLIPGGINNFKKVGASSNRLITSLALGMPTAADIMPSYEPYRDYFIDLRSEIFSSFIDSPLEYSGAVIHAQANVTPKYSQENIRLIWKNLFEALT